MFLALAFTGSAQGEADAPSPTKIEMHQETTAASVCRIIEASAHDQDLPVAFLTRLIWQESSFRPSSISPAGARGIAQFMPKTADERGLADPFDPERAIPKAAELLHDLSQRFGNLGLAAAAYNAGPGRVADWLAGTTRLPSETQNYVLAITGHPVEDWAKQAAISSQPEDQAQPAPAPPPSSCLQVIANIRRFRPNEILTSALVAPWGVQISGSFSKEAALAAYARAQHSYPAILGSVTPMILGGRAPGRGFQPFFRIRAPAQTRAAADALCDKILRVGGACAVLRN